MSAVEEPTPGRAPHHFGSSLLSLVIGAGEMGVEALSVRVKTWDEETALPAASDNGGHDIQDIGVGLIFRSEQVVVATGRTVAGVAGRFGSVVARTARVTGADRVGRSLVQMPLPLVGSIESVVKDLEEVGRVERSRARALAETALRSSTEVSIRDITVRVVEEVAHSAKAREVIRSETTGAAEVIATEIRDVARGADDRLERAVRGVFGRRRGTPKAGPALPGGAPG